MGKWPGKSHLLGQSGLVIGPSYYGAGVTVGLLVCLSLLCLLVPCRYFLEHEDQPAPLVVCLTLSCATMVMFLLTATANPGFIPRQNCSFSRGPELTPVLTSRQLAFHGIARDVPVRGSLLRLRYCRTCNHYERLHLPSSPSFPLSHLRLLRREVRSPLSMGRHLHRSSELPLLPALPPPHPALVNFQPHHFNRAFYPNFPGLRRK